MARQAYVTRLLKKTPQVADIATFRFERPHGSEYRAGQWFVITFAGPTEPYEHHFSYSSSPTEPFLEFTTRLRGTAFKDALDAIPLGTEVEVEGPYGAFTLQEGPERVVFLTAGIGITCVRSILRWLTDSQGGPSIVPSPERIVLLFANRSEDGIPFREELAQMEIALSGLRVVHVLSHPEAGWQGHGDHIDAQILGKELSEARNWAYYLSGPPSFVQSMQELLIGLDVGSGSIKAERFEGYE
jgi:ferredoxin-NADP reductase